jgi:hypothetical protein
MYRYSVDNAVTYTSEDFVLFRESPFACWMERLTLENPDHGIPPDVDSQAPRNSMERQDEVADTLCAEGRDVILVDWEADESRRRRATLEAMRSGVDFIVNGQVALGPLSGSANLLMRTSGFSDLGEFLYVPCDTQSKTTLHSAFRLCFLADLLHSLQGQLPPQMLIIRGGTDVIPLDTEDHIYHYRAVKQRFMEAMRSFRKHRMPDPAESSHFGRWSDCAHEVLKQRALREEIDGPSTEVTEEQLDMPLLAVAGDVVARDLEPAATQRAPDELPLPIMADAAARRAGDSQVAKDPMPTLAEQAVMLDRSALAQASATAAPGHTPNLARAMAAAPVTSGRRLADAVVPAGDTESAPRLFDVALQNLEFIGSSVRGHSIGEIDPEPVAETLPREPVAETLYPALPEGAYQFPDQGESLSWPEPPPPLLSDLTPDTTLHRGAPLELVEELPLELPATQGKPHPLDSSNHSGNSVSGVDLDSAPAAASPESLPPDKGTAFGWQALNEQTEEPDFLLEPAGVNKGDQVEPPFSSSLITNKDYSP